MSWLLDTNIWLELLLDQQRSEEVRSLLVRADPSSLAMTDFTLYSIGIILTRHAKHDLFADFMTDTLQYSGIRLISLSVADLRNLVHFQQQFRLDFDDAYQYTAAVTTGRSLVSFDADFDKLH